MTMLLPSPDLLPPPLSVYIHLPWCVHKCPYCDFNSYALRPGERLPEARYIEALLNDLETELPLVWGRPIHSLFLGGGTPSLFSADSLAELLAELRARLPIRPDTEITLEANPGTVEKGRFAGFRRAGVNRLSLGIQSFAPDALRRLGRIHDDRQALAAIEEARVAGFEELNLDIMFGLPGQDIAAGLHDLQTAIDQQPTHISWYQLTLEPNTLFAARPPELPDEDSIATLFESGQALLQAAGYTRYEISAYARNGHDCQHNRNYWEFGDYLGLGAGAHGKLSLPAEGRIIRSRKRKQPESYLRLPVAREQIDIPTPQLPFEFMLNALRLIEGVPTTWFQERTGLSLDVITDTLAREQQRGLLATDRNRLRATPQGLCYLNDLVASFLPETSSQRHATD